MPEVSEHLEKLWKAVREYVEAEGGNLVVVGNVQVIQMPDDLPGNFLVGVRCTGRKPKFAEGGEPK